MEEKKKTIQKQAKKVAAEVTKKAGSIAKAAEENVSKVVEAASENPSVKEAKKAVKEAAKEIKPVVKEAKKEVKRVAKKAVAKEIKTSVNLQFGGKSYTTDELVKIAKDVWKYDLKKKVGDFKSVELYVKPEENQCYYVINGEVTGNFFI